MRAAILAGERKIIVRDVPKPEAGPGEVVVKVEYAGICGSDLHAYKSLIFPAGTILGHEFTGTIAEPGAGVGGISVGQRIVARPAGICGECEFCRRGEMSLCVHHLENTPGLKVPGGFAEYVKLNSYQVLPLPESVSFQEGAQVEPLAVCYRGAHATQVKVGEPVVIFGAGPIGLLTLQLVRLSGARPVYVVEKSPGRRRKAAQFGAETVLDFSPDLPARIRDQEKNGPRIIFDCVGIEETLNSSLEIVKAGGRIVMIGATARPFPVNQLRWLQKGITVIASMGYFMDDFSAALSVLEKKMVDVGSLVSNVIALEDIEKGIQSLENAEQALKVLVRP